MNQTFQLNTLKVNYSETRKTAKVELSIKNLIYALSEINVEINLIQTVFFSYSINVDHKIRSQIKYFFSIYQEN
jgi:hypothetical protein